MLLRSDAIFVPQLSAIAATLVMVLLRYTLRQWQLWKQHQPALAGRSPERMRRRLNLRRQHIVIYHERSYTELPLVQFTREVHELGPEARTKALAKVQQLEQSLLYPEPQPRIVNRRRPSAEDTS